MLQDNEKMKVQYLRVFRLICLKLCRLLGLSERFSLDFKFRCYGNQNQNCCLLLKKQKVYCLSKTDAQKVIWNNTVWLLLQVVSNFEEKLVIHSSYCEKATVFCFWTNANSSRLSCHSNESLKSSEIRLFTSNSLQNFKQIKQKTPEVLHFHFFNVLQDCVCDVIFKWKRG